MCQYTEAGVFHNGVGLTLYKRGIQFFYPQKNRSPIAYGGVVDLRSFPEGFVVGARAAMIIVSKEEFEGNIVVLRNSEVTIRTDDDIPFTMPLDHVRLIPR